MNETVALAGLLRDYGPWGLLAVSLMVNWWLARKLLGCFEAQVDEGGKTGAALEKASQTSAAQTAAYEGRANQTDDARRDAAVERQTIITSLARIETKLDLDIRGARA